MPRKKASRVEEPEDLVFEDVLDEEETVEREDGDGYRKGGLDLYDENGDLMEEGEPTYIDDEEADDE